LSNWIWVAEWPDVCVGRLVSTRELFRVTGVDIGVDCGVAPTKGELFLLGVITEEAMNTLLPGCFSARGLR
jgi:hypothetical protein